MKIVKTLLFALVATSLFSCKDDDDNDIKPVVKNKTFEYTFAKGDDGWVGDYADYEAAKEKSYTLSTKHMPLPAPLKQTDKGLRQVGKNLNKDLFMFVKKKVTGLLPKQEYKVMFDIQIASNAPVNAESKMGRPAEHVYIKAGASTTEPKKAEDNKKIFRLNLDKGNHHKPGKMILMGNFANGTKLSKYALRQLKTYRFVTVKANDKGEAWLIVGTDSKYGGTTSIYYNKIKATFKK
ncbi:hypothetical protein FUAX_06900 [Fulvitalea axinellae]|uniref:Lipoprotein n=1 Tax=Fulvitalea axinellae TaxID=1182444 RepID=A0AAU9CXE3_9BACT|nr:hypothetical protein FUAX_06900 [Fulvitalea axinellae]